MPNIGPLEIAIVVIIALIVFGPKRLPELGRSLGDGMREFKASISGEDRDDDDDDDLPVQVESSIDADEDAEDDAAADEPKDAVVAEESADSDAAEKSETAERTPS